MTARAVAMVVVASLFIARPLGAQAEAPRRLALQAAGGCPSQALVAAELAPLLRGFELGNVAPELVARVRDLGTAYRVTVGEARREVSDPERQCLERARVAAVFIALNLPAREVSELLPAAPELSRAAPERPVSQEPGPKEPVPATTRAPALPQRALGLRGFAQVEVAPDADVSSTGVGAGIALSFGAIDVSLLAAVTTATRPNQPDGQAALFELQRLPFSLLAGWTESWGLVSIGAEIGLALDLLRFRGKEVPRPDEGLRVNTGLRWAGLLRIHGSRRLQAELVPSLSYFPRTYLAEVEPSRVVGETPAYWFGLSLGLRYRIWSE